MNIRGLSAITALLLLASGSAWSMSKPHGLLLDCRHSSPNFVGQAVSGRTMMMVDRVNLTAHLDQSTPREWEPVLQQLDANKVSFSLRDEYGPLGFVTVNRRTGGLNGWWAEYKLGYRTVSGQCDIIDVDANPGEAQAIMDAHRNKYPTPQLSSR